MSIEVSNLVKNYGAQKAVNDISFSVNPGEIVGFLGPNGAGKSTTMKIITGYIDQDGGVAKVCGINVQDDPIGSKQKIGYLPEANPLYYDMYVREYLDFIAGVHQVADRKSRIETVIAMVGLTPESRKKIGQLSKGYKQRAGLAAALLHDPEVLILDEPTTGLDPNQIVEIRAVIRNLGKSKTILFSSHILQEVEAICDRVIIINKGTLVANDLLENLRNSGEQRHVVLVQFKEKVAAELFQGQAAVNNSSQAGDGPWRLGTSDPELLRKQLFEMALQHKLNIVSLQSESNSLEDIFRSLTNNNAAAQPS